MKTLLVYPHYPDTFRSFRRALKFIGRKQAFPRPVLAVTGRERLHFWKLFFCSLAKRPRLFPLAINHAIYGFHFRKVAEKYRVSGMFDSNDACD